MNFRINTTSDVILLKAAAKGYDIKDILMTAAYLSILPGTHCINIDVSDVGDADLQPIRAKVNNGKLPVKILKIWKNQPDAAIASWIKMQAIQMLINYNSGGIAIEQDISKATMPYMNPSSMTVNELDPRDIKRDNKPNVSATRKSENTEAGNKVDVMPSVLDSREDKCNEADDKTSVLPPSSEAIAVPVSSIPADSEPGPIKTKAGGNDLTSSAPEVPVQTYHVPAQIETATGNDDLQTRREGKTEDNERTIDETTETAYTEEQRAAAQQMRDAVAGIEWENFM